MASLSKLSSIDDSSSDEDVGIMIGKKERGKKKRRKKLSNKDIGILKPLYDDSFRSEKVLHNIFSFQRNVKLFRMGFVSNRIRYIASSNRLWRDRVNDKEFTEDSPLRLCWARERLIRNVRERRKMDNLCDDVMTLIFSMMEDKDLYKLGWVCRRLRKLSSQDFVWEKRTSKEDLEGDTEENRTKMLLSKLPTELASPAALQNPFEMMIKVFNAFNERKSGIELEDMMDEYDNVIIMDSDPDSFEDHRSGKVTAGSIEKYGDKIIKKSDIKSLREQFHFDLTFIKQVQEMAADDQKISFQKHAKRSQNAVRSILFFRCQRTFFETIFAFLPRFFDVFILICYTVLLALYISVFDEEDDRDTISLIGFILHPSQLLLQCCFGCFHSLCGVPMIFRIADAILTRRARDMRFRGEHGGLVRRQHRSDPIFQTQLMSQGKNNEWAPIACLNHLIEILKFFFFSIFTGLYFGNTGTVVCICLLWFGFGCCICGVCWTACGCCGAWCGRCARSYEDFNIDNLWDEDGTALKLLFKGCSSCFPICSLCFFATIMTGIVLVEIFFLNYTLEATDEWHDAVYITTIILLPVFLLCCPCWCIARSCDLGKILTVGFEKKDTYGYSRYEYSRRRMRKKNKYFAEDCAFFPYLDLLYFWVSGIFCLSLIIPLLILFLEGDPSNYEDETISFWYIPVSSFLVLVSILLCCVCCGICVVGGFKMQRKARKSVVLNTLTSEEKKKKKGFDIGLLDPKSLTMRSLQFLKDKIRGGAKEVEVEEEDEELSDYDDVHNPFTKLRREDFSDTGISDDDHDIIVVNHGSLAKEMLRIVEQGYEFEIVPGTIERLAHEMVDVGKITSSITFSSDEDSEEIVEDIVVEVEPPESSSSDEEVPVEKTSPREKDDVHEKDEEKGGELDGSSDSGVDIFETSDDGDD